MSSYFDYFCKNLENDNRIETEYIKGTCYSMCPQEEVRLREKESLVHVLEVVGSVHKLVKSYSRSAADSNMAIPSMLRPYSILEDTVQYLLFDVTKRKDVPMSVVYDFITDRLRAVRQDMTIQRLPHEECIRLLEPMVRFHVFYGYMLSNYPLKHYDPVLNKKYLLECIKWFLSCCDKIDQGLSNGKIEELSGFFSDLNIKDNKINRLKCDRVLMESLYILCNLDDIHPLFRYLNLPKDLKSDSKLSLIFKIALAHLKGNYIRVYKLLDTLCPLTYCALSAYLPVLQRNALLKICYAYNNKRLTVPSSAIRRWLHLSTEEEVQAVCSHYGLQSTGAAVRFDKGDFKDDAVLHQITIQDTINLDFSIDNIFTYK